jgi:hypothetical protein
MRDKKTFSVDDHFGRIIGALMQSANARISARALACSRGLGVFPAFTQRSNSPTLAERGLWLIEEATGIASADLTLSHGLK